MEFKHGDQKMILRKMDCIYFDASIPHGGKVIGDKPSKVFTIFCSGENNKSPFGGSALSYSR